MLLVNQPNSKLPKIHAHLAKLGYGSRRQIEKLILDGAVKIDGQVAEIGQRVDPVSQRIEFNQQLITSLPTNSLQTQTWAINKPIGYVSTTRDELNRPTVIDFWRRHQPKQTNTRLYPVGRLDRDSQGLLLLTNDGQLTLKLSHPRYQVQKTYEVELIGVPSDKAVAHFERGVKLAEGYTQPAKLNFIRDNGDHSWWQVTIHEGKYRQVRRMWERVGYEVVLLTRTAIGGFTLEVLAGNPVKLLSASEISLLQSTDQE